VAASSSTVIALGDSLTAGYGLAPEEAFPVRLQQALKARGHDVTVINAGVSGDTTAGGLARLEWTLADVADGLVIVELGANDALRGLPPTATRDNLDRIITRIKARGLKVLLAGMLAPPNMGDDYAAAFNAIYPELAQKHGVAFDPFFLDGVAAKPELNQADGMHPTAAGVAAIAERLAPLVIEALKQGR
jgi:acyl-CoA thioesterase-1